MAAARLAWDATTSYPQQRFIFYFNNNVLHQVGGGRAAVLKILLREVYGYFVSAIFPRLAFRENCYPCHLVCVIFHHVRVLQVGWCRPQSIRCDSSTGAVDRGACRQKCSKLPHSASQSRFLPRSLTYPHPEPTALQLRHQFTPPLFFSKKLRILMFLMVFFSF